MYGVKIDDRIDQSGKHIVEKFGADQIAQGAFWYESFQSE